MYQNDNKRQPVCDLPSFNGQFNCHTRPIEIYLEPETHSTVNFRSANKSCVATRQIACNLTTTTPDFRWFFYYLSVVGLWHAMQFNQLKLCFIVIELCETCLGVSQLPRPNNFISSKLFAESNLVIVSNGKLFEMEIDWNANARRHSDICNATTCGNWVSITNCNALQRQRDQSAAHHYHWSIHWWHSWALRINM